MSGKIAVLSNELFNIDASAMALTVLLFERDALSWVEKDKFYVNFPADSGLISAREDILRLITRLGDCRIAAGPGISGVLYRELDRNGFFIFETQDWSPGTLDGILRDLEETGDTTAAAPVRPVETEKPGVYSFDLIRLQSEHPEITSKQALREFLETTPFYELHLFCTHVPPWLEGGAYDVSTAQAGGTLAATVRNKQCKGD